MRVLAGMALIVALPSGCRAPLADGTSFAPASPTLAVDDTGPADAATTLLLVHGWSCDRSLWGGALEPLAPAARVIAVDLPGHGESPAADDYSLDATADALAELLDELGVERAVAVGHSNGTPVVRQLYRRHPERTEALVIVDGALVPMASADQLRGFADAIRQDPAVVEPMVEGMLPRDEHAAERVRSVVLSTEAEVMAATLEAVAEPAIWEEDPIEVPVLVVQAAAPHWDEEYEAFVHELAPDVRYHVLTGVSHFLMLDEPETFRELVAAFLAEL